jgi:putative NADPH-quinone reductase
MVLSPGLYGPVDHDQAVRSLLHAIDAGSSFIDTSDGYGADAHNERLIGAHLDAVKWAEALVFIYPTWWYGLPAILKGWLDRVWIPYVTFTLPDGNEPIRGLMRNIVRIVGISTSGASRLWLAFIGNPGRRTITRGVRALCHPRCRTLWLAHYNIDHSTAHSREAFLEQVGRELAGLK